MKFENYFISTKKETNELVSFIREHLMKILTVEQYNRVDKELKSFEKRLHERTENYASRARAVESILNMLVDEFKYQPNYLEPHDN